MIEKPTLPCVCLSKQVTTPRSVHFTRAVQPSTSRQVPTDRCAGGWLSNPQKGSEGEPRKPKAENSKKALRQLQV